MYVIALLRLNCICYIFNIARRKKSTTNRGRKKKQIIIIIINNKDYVDKIDEYRIEWAIIIMIILRIQFLYYPIV